MPRKKKEEKVEAEVVEAPVETKEVVEEKPAKVEKPVKSSGKTVKVSTIKLGPAATGLKNYNLEVTSEVFDIVTQRGWLQGDVAESVVEDLYPALYYRKKDFRFTVQCGDKKEYIA